MPSASQARPPSFVGRPSRPADFVAPSRFLRRGELSQSSYDWRAGESLVLDRCDCGGLGARDWLIGEARGEEDLETGGLRVATERAEIGGFSLGG